jgi:ACS family hexuronate transporter-like MFS transporter
MSHDRAPAWRWSVCGLLLVATMLNHMERQTLSESSIGIHEEPGLSFEELAKLGQGFRFAFALGAIALGVVADRVNPRWFYRGSRDGLGQRISRVYAMPRSARLF